MWGIVFHFISQKTPDAAGLLIFSAPRFSFSPPHNQLFVLLFFFFSFFFFSSSSSTSSSSIYFFRSKIIFLKHTKSNCKTQFDWMKQLFWTRTNLYTQKASFSHLMLGGDTYEHKTQDSAVEHHSRKTFYETSEISPACASNHTFTCTWTRNQNI